MLKRKNSNCLSGHKLKLIKKNPYANNPYYENGFTCDKCGENGLFINGAYCCTTCEYDLHKLCKGDHNKFIWQVLSMPKFFVKKGPLDFIYKL